MDKKEKKNLSRLLLSPDDNNVELGLELLSHHKDVIPELHRELVVIAHLHAIPEIRTKSANLLTLCFDKSKRLKWTNAFKVFHDLAYYSNKSSLRHIDNHEAMRPTFEPFIVQNPNYASFYGSAAVKMNYYSKVPVISKKEAERIFAPNPIPNRPISLTEAYLRINLKANPDDLEALSCLSRNVLGKIKECLPEAIQILEKVNSQRPNDTSTLTSLAALHEKNNAFEKTYDYYKQTIVLNPNSPYYKNLIVSLCTYKLHKEPYISEAESYLLERKEKESTKSHFYVALGNFLWLARKDYEGCEEAYLKGLEYGPTNTDLLGNLAELYVDEFQDYDMGWHYYQKTLEQNCSGYQLINIVTFLTLHKKDYSLAKEIYKTLKEKYNNKEVSRESFLSEKQWSKFLEAQETLKNV